MDLSLFLNKHKFKLAFGFFLAYLALTMYKIGDNSLWYDECFSIDLGNDTVTEIFSYSWYNDTNPPLYILIVHYWMKIFGNSETALRSISAISGSLACGLFFLFSLRYFNWQTAIFSVLLFFTSNELYFYSEEGRTYGLILLFTVLSNFAFMSLINRPRFLNAFLLGFFNICVFYMHTLGCINIVGQVVLAFILGFDWDTFKKKTPDVLSFLGYKVKFIIWYIVSWVVFGVLFWPWEERFFGIIKDGAKGFWLQKPTFVEYKQVLFDFYNSETLFYVYASLIVVVLLLLVFVKKLRETSFNYKLLLIPIVLGPVLYNFDYFAASITPIFLKRYILFTLLGFILLFAYLISSVKLDFRIKLGGVLTLCLFSFLSMKIPRPEQWDYNDGVKFIKEKLVATDALITTDNSMLFAYYFDRKGAFMAYQKERDEILGRSNIYYALGTDWPYTKDFSSYSDIYFTESFDHYNDPEKKVVSFLKKNFIWVEDTSFAALHITHYVNSNPSIDLLKEVKIQINNNKEWYNQIPDKAKSRGVSIDSMLTIDALWYFNTQVLPKRIKRKW